MPNVDFEFVVEDCGTTPDDFDVIEHGRGRWSRPGSELGILLLAASVVVAGAAFVIASSRHHPAPPSPRPSTAVGSPAPPGAAALGLAHLVTVAQSGALRDDVLSDTGVICPRASAAAASQSVMAVLGEDLPGFSLIDAGATRGARGTLCGLEVRARDAVGTTVIVTVLAPPDADSAAFEVSSGNDRLTVLVVCAIENSWSVQVGWAARTGSEMSFVDLETVAHDDRLRW